jgi:hypothetical protein
MKIIHNEYAKAIINLGISVSKINPFARYTKTAKNRKL